MTVRRATLLIAFVAGLCAPVAEAQVVAILPVPGPCVDGTLPSGALSRICVPQLGWNGRLVVFAHGYVAPGPVLDFANLRLTDGTYLPDLVQQLGFAFATTSYRRNGLAILEGTADVLELVQAFEAGHGAPTRTYLTGASEGGLVTTLAAERYPGQFTAAYALCGPIGSFRLQVNYVGDFRVLFDYYYPGLIPGSAIDIPDAVRANWDSYYAPMIAAELVSNPGRARELLRVAKAPYDPAVPDTVANTALGLLWYNVFATNDAKARLGGNPYGNQLRWYFGSSNDLLLNLSVSRFVARPAAVKAMQSYTPSGDLRIPLVTLHTIADEIVPYAHELVYTSQVEPRDRGRFVPLPVLRYGHCNVTTSEVLAGFAIMVLQ